jgi:hypothetical protein
VALCRENRDDDIVIVTADRALRDRVAQFGARVVGPTMLRVRR